MVDMAYNTKPSLKQKKAFSNYLTSGGNMKRALLSAGYSRAIAKNPSKVRESKGFQLLLEKVHLSDGAIAQKHKELIDSEDPRVTYQAIDVFYKLKGYYRGDTNANLTNFQEFIKEISE